MSQRQDDGVLLCLEMGVRVAPEGGKDLEWSLLSLLCTEKT